MNALPQGLGAQLWKVRLPDWVENSRAAYGQGEHNNNSLGLLPALPLLPALAWLGFGTAAVATGTTIYGMQGMLQLRKAYSELNSAFGVLWRKVQKKHGAMSDQAQTVEYMLERLQHVKADVDDTVTIFGTESEYWAQWKLFESERKTMCDAYLTGVDAATECGPRPDLLIPDRPIGASAAGNQPPIPWDKILWGSVGVVTLGGIMYIAGQMIGAGMRNRSTS